MESSHFLIWNVRGLNDRAKRDSVKSLVVDIKPSIVLEYIRQHRIWIV
jgi:hypothetical protein